MLEKRLEELIRSKSPYLAVKKIEHSNLIFEERVLLQCRHCSKHKVVWTCPPNLPDIDFRKLFSEYDNALIVYCKIPFTEDTFDIVRVDSSNLLHRTLLEAEKFLWGNDHPLAVSFIAGSCKLCTNGCDPHGCRQPTLARIPLEATGVNVVKSLESINLTISFPPKDNLYRLGLLLW